MVRINNLNNGYYKRLRISDFFSEGENRMVFGERMVLKGYEEYGDVYILGRGYGDVYIYFGVYKGWGCLFFCIVVLWYSIREGFLFYLEYRLF